MSDEYANHYDDQPRATIESNRMRFGMFSWEGQAPQYDQLGEPGSVVYRRYTEGQATWVDVLLHYDHQGRLDGIFNTYPFGAASHGGEVLEKAGSSNAFIRPDVADPDALYQSLLAEGRRRWPLIRGDVDHEVRSAISAPAINHPDLSQRDVLRRTRPIEAIAPTRGDGIDGNRRISRRRER